MKGIGRFLAVLALGLAVPLAAAGRPAILEVRLGQHPDKTRLVLELSQAPSYRSYLVENPPRLVVELAGADWAFDPRALPAGRGAVAALRFARFDAATSRLVADLATPVRLMQPVLLAGGGSFRLVIDLVPVDGSEVAAGSVIPISAEDTAPVGVDPPLPDPMPAAAPAPLQVASLGFPPPAKPPSPHAKPIVVIDPGHGGVDPGTIGAGGTYEKTITLAMAREVKRVLEATGRYQVVLTRDEDVFIPLRQRIQIARQAHGDVFISLHADSHASDDTRGASVYTLSETASDAEAEDLAQRENKADLIAGVDLSKESEVVTGILIDLAQRETMNLSARFAGLLVDEMARSTMLLRNTHRFAGFAVLKAPDVASVLVEMGYLSNRDDEALLNTKAHRKQLAEAIRRALDRYFD
jgi:N-acetylmuramoyl-L-alanine amidase